ncbi:MAG TPA: 50S ribosomal protein L30 [Fastidiosipila sp.]|jgi:large subunit ribosomal protein L30|nr:50S ribosomal protein L30 [Fastidiosipila sp.]
MSKNEKTIIVTLKKSPLGSNRKQVRTVQALGLTKIGQSVEKHATPTILGMVRRVAHLVEVKDQKESGNED